MGLEAMLATSLNPPLSGIHNRATLPCMRVAAAPLGYTNEPRWTAPVVSSAARRRLHPCTLPTLATAMIYLQAWSLVQLQLQMHLIPMTQGWGRLYACKFIAADILPRNIFMWESYTGGCNRWARQTVFVEAGLTYPTYMDVTDFPDSHVFG